VKLLDYKTLRSFFTTKHLLGLVLVIFILILPFQTRQILSETSSQYTTLSLYLFDVGFIIVALAWLWYWYQHPDLKVNLALVSTGLTMIILTGLSNYWADNHNVALFYWLHLMQGAWLIAIIATSRIDRRILLGAVVLNGMIQAVFIIFQSMDQMVVAHKWLGIAEQIPTTSGVAVVVTEAGRWLRAYGTMPHPNIVAGLLVISLCAAIIVWLEVNHYMTRVLLLASIALMSTGLLLTFSRSAMIIWCVCLVLFISLKRSSYKLVLVSGITISLIGALYWPLITARTSATQYIEQLSITERSDQLTEAWQLFTHYWPEGTGIGQYTLLVSTTSNPQPVHNIFLLQLVELGILITIVWYGFIGLVIYYSLQNPKKVTALHVLIIALLGLGLFDHYFWTLPSMLLLFCLILGIILQPTEGY